MRTVHLGQFTDEVANEIAGELHDAGIHWHHKQAARLTRVLFAGEWGTRLFVDADRVDEAKEIAQRVMRRTGREGA